MQTKEISWTTPDAPIPPPCFADRNITVYALPISPEQLNTGSDIPAATTSSTEPSPVPTVSASSPKSSPEKRKRKASPVSPRKRPNSGSLAPIMIQANNPLAEVRNYGFDPLSLSGPDADEYRNMVIKGMFPNTKPNTALDPAARKESRRRSREGMRAKALGLRSSCLSRNELWTPSIRKKTSSSRGQRSRY